MSHSSLLRSLALSLASLCCSPLLAPASALAQGSGYWHTSGNRLLDANNQVVRLAGINWYGFETTRAVPGGLTSQDYKSILQTAKSQGYNTLRIPFSNQMVESPQIPSSISFANGINADLQNLNSLQILDAIIAQAGALNLKVILDNHRSEAGDSAESNGLWYTGQYPESAWINDWTALAQRYANNPTVIGFDLRNEPHNANSGGSCWDCGGANDWHLAAARAGNAVLSINPNLLIFVEGTDAYNNDYTWWGGNLEGVQNSPVTLSIPNQLVYSAHEYGPHEYQQSWFNGNTTYSSLASVWSTHWAFITQNNIAPVWLGEFGTTNNASDIQDNGAGSQGQYFQSLVQFLGADATLNWTYWALNGEDTYGLLDANYDPTPASNLKQQALASIQFQVGSGGGTTTPPPSTAPSGPAAPTSLTATPASSSQVNLAWQASTTAGVTYTVYASTTQGFAASSSSYVTSGLTSTSYSATGLSASTTWYFIVQSVLNGTGSAYTATASATTSAAAAPTPPPSGGGGGTSGGVCHVVYTDTNDWGSGMTGGISITNTGSSPIAGWTLTWAYSGNQQLTQSWNGSYTQNGDVVSITDAGYNGSIAPGATQSGIGFNASYSGANTSPGTFYLNGQLCN